MPQNQIDVMIIMGVGIALLVIAAIHEWRNKK